MQSTLKEKLARISSEIKQIDCELKGETDPESGALYELREALDNLRLTTWTTMEVMHARSANESARTITLFLASERLRRFEQMASHICTDLDQGAIPAEDFVLLPLIRSLSLLQQRIGKDP